MPNGQEHLVKTHIPDRLTVQWHMTDRCNLRCQHCYQEDYADNGLRIDDLKKIARQVFSLQEHWKNAGKRPPLLFTLTGGEPSIHPDFKALIDFLGTHPSNPSIAVLSNGTQIDATLAQYFASRHIAFVQLSIDGTPTTHDTIRGKGNFDQVLAATHRLSEAGIRVLWSFTAHQENYREFAKVARLAYQHRVSRLWSDRMIPIERTNAPQTLTPEQSIAYFQIMYQAKRDIEKMPDNRTEIALARALQFQIGGGQPYRCSAAESLITLMPDGALLPCRRLPVPVGNVLTESLISLYENAPLFQALRSVENPDECQECTYRSSCRGGLRCLAHAQNAKMFSADPGCIYLQTHATQNTKTIFFSH